MEIMGAGYGEEQSRGIVSNVNVHSKALSIAEMKKYTQRGNTVHFKEIIFLW